MNITIVTTEKKLTKSLIHQMRMPAENIMRCGKSLGYIINAFAKVYKIALIEYEGEYFVLPLNYKKSSAIVYRRVGKNIVNKSFADVHACDLWWKSYERIKADTTGQIYL